MSFQTTLGSVPFRAVAPDVFAPEKGAVSFSLSPGGPGSFDATWCGMARRYRRVRPSNGKTEEVTGRWRSTLGTLAAEIESEGSALRIRLGSALGATTWPLAWVEPDLLLAGSAIEVSPTRPWGFTLRRAGEELLLSTERVRALRFRRV